MQNQGRNSELKKLAKSAKSRLKSGYWQGLNENELANVSFHKENAIITSYADEEAMYAKVRAMLSENECVLDPLGKLMNMEIYNNLDQAGKARYVLQLSKLYIKLKDRYYREKGNL